MAKQTCLTDYLFIITNEFTFEPEWGGAKCPKFNIVGGEEINNYELAKLIADSQHRDLKYEFVDFHSSRLGHDLRYSLDGDKMKKLGWEPEKSTKERILEVVDWTIKNDRWLNV